MSGRSLLIHYAISRDAMFLPDVPVFCGSRGKFWVSVYNVATGRGRKGVCRTCRRLARRDVVRRVLRGPGLTAAEVLQVEYVFEHGGPRG